MGERLGGPDAAHAAPPSLATLMMPGDAMAPGICDGDLIEVDLRASRVDRDGVYVLRDADGRPMVRRVQREAGGTWLLIPANRDYPSERVARGSVPVHGRVLRTWGLRAV